MAGENEQTAGDGLQKRILAALEAVVVLHVTTVVGKAKAGAIGASGVAEVTLEDGEQKLADTVINTMAGNCVTIYTPDFQADPALMALHKTAIDTAQQVRKDTLDLLKTALTDFEKLLTGKPPL
jgi:hypothetical protein